MSENNNQSLGDLFPDLGPEVPIISGVAHDNTESLATVRRVPNEPGMAAKVFALLAEAGVNVDMIDSGSATEEPPNFCTMRATTYPIFFNVLSANHSRQAGRL